MHIFSLASFSCGTQTGNGLVVYCWLPFFSPFTKWNHYDIIFVWRACVRTCTWVCVRALTKILSSNCLFSLVHMPYAIYVIYIYINKIEHTPHSTNKFPFNSLGFRIECHVKLTKPSWRLLAYIVSLQPQQAAATTKSLYSYQHNCRFFFFCFFCSPRRLTRGTFMCMCVYAIHFRLAHDSTSRNCRDGR